MTQTILSIIGMALIIAVVYWIVNIDAGVLSAVFQMSPVVTGLVLGLIFGDVKTALVTGALINMLYLSLNQVGGNISMDPSMAAVLMIPIAVRYQTGPAFAAAVSLPLSLIGGALDNCRRRKNAKWIEEARKCARSGDTRGIAVNNMIRPALTQAVIRIPAVFALAFAVTCAARFGFEVLPAWLTRGVSLAGILFAAMGVVSCAVHTESGKQIYLSLAVFLAAAVSGLPLWICEAAVIAGAAVWTYLQWKKTYTPAPQREMPAHEGTLDGKTLQRTGFLLPLVFRFGNNFENFFGTGICHALAEPLSKVYRGKPEELSEALERHLDPFITEITVGSAVVGAALAMEEQKAAGEGVEGEAIAGLKSSLMGPYAGFGDPFFNGTVAAFFRCVFVPFAAFGGIAGILGEILYRGIGWIVSMKCFVSGYRYGKVILLKLMKNPVIGYLKAALPAAIMLLLGVIAGSVLTPILAESRIITLETVPAVSRLLNAVVLLAFMAGGYMYLKKSGKFLRLLAVTAAAAVLIAVIF